jgi:ATP phosphoribosyltransferase
MWVGIRAEADSNIEITPETGHAEDFIDRSATLTTIDTHGLTIVLFLSKDSELMISEKPKETDNV